ncbi:serine hydrolase domain-containing protein [Bacillaceae bacterium IKA-2]|nr:serine hydrolase domain-containing protein [Bacillaceae bacterium IKA-2]
MRKKILFSIATTAIIIFSFVFSYSFTSEAFSMNLSTKDKLDQYIENVAKKLAIPGMTVAISHKGELIYSEAFGKDVHQDTRFYIGSTSKTFTALAVMQLVEQGKVDLDQSVATYLKDFTVSNQITVRHLLQHVSGMTEFDYISKLPDDAKFSDLIQDMNQMSLTYVPGEQFSYFNPNYSLLGAIIENMSGQSYVDYLEQHIIQPLGLQNTSLIGEVDTTGHLSFFGLSIKRTEPHIEYDLPAGFITSTAEDVVRFFEAIRMIDPIVGVSPEGIDEMKSSDFFYGMGLMIGEIAGQPAIFHGGALPGYTSDAVMLTEDEYSIVYLINKNHLLNGFVFNPDLTSGIVSLLTEQEPPTRVNYFWIYRLLFILFAATIIYNMINISKMIVKPKPKTIRQRVTAAITNLVIPVAVIIGIPIISGVVMQRGMTWELAFLVMPDMIAWLYIALSIHLIQSAVHFVFIVKHYLRLR